MPLTFSVDHVGISLTAVNLEATIEWYTSKLDFVIERRFETHGISFAFIARDDFRIELVGAASDHQAPVTSIATSHNTERLHHLCLAVENLSATLAELHDRGVDPLNEPMHVPVIGQTFTFITDNLGNIIELTEPGTRPAESRS